MGRKKGYKMSEEQKSKISKANTGKKKPNGFLDAIVKLKGVKRELQI